MNDLFRMKKKQQKPDSVSGLQDVIVYVNTNEIVVDDRIRGIKNISDNEIDDMVESIATFGLLQPILINIENKLVCGGRRLLAHRRLQKDKIAAVITAETDVETLRKMEAEENVRRKAFSFRETMAYVAYLESMIAEKREAGDESVKAERTLDITANAIGWGRAKLANAKTVMHNAIDDVIDAIGEDGGLSVNGAYRISQLPKKQQKQALNAAVNFPDSDGDQLLKHNIKRRKINRDKENSIPPKYKPHPIFSLVRVAPDWDKQLLSDITEIPVHDYLAAKAVCTIEVPAQHLQRAMTIISSWGLLLDSVITVTAPRCDTHPGNAVASEWPCFILICKNIDEFDPIREFITCGRPAAVHEIERRVETQGDVIAALFNIIQTIFPGDEKRVDMTSVEKPAKGWIAWKASYGISSNDPVDTTGDLFEQTDNAAIIDEMIDDAEPDGVENN